MESSIKKLQDQRRELSAALIEIVDQSVVLKGDKHCLVPAKTIEDAKKVYGRIWRKA